MPDVMIREAGFGCSHRKLKCNPLNIEYNFQTRAGVLSIEDGDCCDMAGCIEVFHALDQDVKVITVFSGGVVDISYRRNDQGEWRSHRDAT